MSLNMQFVMLRLCSHHNHNICIRKSYRLVYEYNNQPKYRYKEKEASWETTSTGVAYSLEDWIKDLGEADERKKTRTLAQCLGYYNSYLKQTYVHVPECVCIWQRLKRWAFALNWYMLHLILDGGG